ncbi:MAG: RNase adapter RapZ [Wenzhouxiangellaceae bacterium]
MSESCVSNPDSNTAPLLVTGLSGSGKSVALNALEDQGYYCVDNLPSALLPTLIDEWRARPERYRRLAVGVDARAGAEELKRLPELIRALPVTPRLLFLSADPEVLIQRFSETRRRHPLGDHRTLAQAIEAERALLEPLAEVADECIDTSETNIHELRRLVWRLVEPDQGAGISNLVLESFAFKKGVPRDVDLVFDARCLPNPHWQPELRHATGLEQPVREFLASMPKVQAFADDVDAFITRWLPEWAGEQRSHLTVGIGCTGGRHRSVYLVDMLAARWRQRGLNVAARHRELER